FMRALPVNAARNGVTSTTPTNVGTFMNQAPVSFRMGPDGSLYVVFYGAGSVSRFTPIDMSGPGCGVPGTGGGGGAVSVGGAPGVGGATGKGGVSAGGVTARGGSATGTGASNTGTGASNTGTGGSGKASSKDQGGCGCRVAASRDAALS